MGTRPASQLAPRARRVPRARVPPDLFQFEPEWVRLVGDYAAADLLDCRHHAAVTAQHPVGERHNARLFGVAVAETRRSSLRDRALRRGPG